MRSCVFWWTFIKLRVGNNLTRLEAAKKLAGLNDARAVKPLLVALKDSWPPVQEWAAYGLGNIGDAHALEPMLTLLSGLSGGNNIYVARAAGFAVGKIGGTRAVEPLRAMLKHRQYAVRSAAALALDSLGWKPENDTERALWAVVSRKWEDVVRLGNTALEPLLEFGDRDTLSEFAKIGSPAVELLTTMLIDSHNRVRGEVAEALGKTQDARAVAPLTEALNRLNEQDRNAYTYWSVADTQRFLIGGLEKIGEPAVEALIWALGDDNPHYVRQLAIGALGRIGDIRAEEPLVAALKDADCSLRAKAVEALGEIKSSQPFVAEALVKCLDDVDRRVSESAAHALARVKDPRCVDPLVCILRSDHVHSQLSHYHAVQVLARFLEGAANCLSEDSLNKLACLDDAIGTHSIHTSDIGYDGSETYNATTDCSPIRLLARTELERRG